MHFVYRDGIDGIFPTKQNIEWNSLNLLSKWLVIYEVLRLYMAMEKECNMNYVNVVFMVLRLTMFLLKIITEMYKKATLDYKNQTNSFQFYF